METRTQRIFKISRHIACGSINTGSIALIALMPLATSVTIVHAAGDTNATNSRMGALLEPKVEQQQIKEPKIDSEHFEIGLFTGLLSIEHFGSEPAYGLFMNYHATEDIFLQASAHASSVGKTSFEILTGSNSLTEEERDLTSYSLSAGLNILPGESFWWGNRAFNNALTALIGIGSTDFAGDDHFTISLGLSYRLLINDLFAVQVQVSDYLFEQTLFEEDETTHNLFTHIGLSVFF